MVKIHYLLSRKIFITYWILKFYKMEQTLWINNRSRVKIFVYLKYLSYQIEGLMLLSIKVSFLLQYENATPHSYFTVYFYILSANDSYKSIFQTIFLYKIESFAWKTFYLLIHYFGFLTTILWKAPQLSIGMQ